MAAVNVTLYAARNVDFADELFVDYYGDEMSLTGATLTFEVRQYGGQAGDPLVEDDDVEITSHAQIGTGVDPSDGVTKAIRRLSFVPSISDTALAAIAGTGTEAGEPITFKHETKLIHADGFRESLMIGDFILSPGVNAA